MLHLCKGHWKRQETFSEKLGDPGRQKRQGEHQGQIARCRRRKEVHGLKIRGGKTLEEEIVDACIRATRDREVRRSSVTF